MIETTKQNNTGLKILNTQVPDQEIRNSSKVSCNSAFVAKKHIATKTRKHKGTQSENMQRILLDPRE